MNITLTLGDFLAMAAVVAVVVRGSQFYIERPTPQQLRMQRQLDAIMSHLGLPEPAVSRAGALSPQVVALITDGRRIDAIRLYRQETGAGLKEAKDAVELHAAAASAPR